MTAVFLLQLALPLLFIGWIALAPLKSTLGFFCQCAGTAAGLCALALTGLWLFPPWWTPYVFACLGVAAVFVGWRRFRFASRQTSGWMPWILMAAFIGVGSWRVYRSASALAGRTPAAGAIVDLAFPLEGGMYLVVSGGSNITVNPHLMTLDASVCCFCI